MAIKKFCMQCDRQEHIDINRRCRFCRFLSCPSCMPEGETLCNHCNETRIDIPGKETKTDE